MEQMQLKKKKKHHFHIHFKDLLSTLEAGLHRPNRVYGLQSNLHICAGCIRLVALNM